MPYSDQVIAKRLEPDNIKVSVLPAARNSTAYQGRPPCCGNNNCTPLCPISAQYSADIHIKRAITNGAKLLANAVAFKIDSDRNGSITTVHYKRPDSSIGKLSGKHFVLACNGIETPKLLMQSTTEALPRGIANSSGQVGRNLMDHPSIALSMLMPEPVYPGRGPQVVSQINHGRGDTFRNKHSAGKIFIQNQPDIQGYVTDLIEDQQTWSTLDRDLEKYASRYIMIGTEMEQLPNVSNYIKPSTSRMDTIGIAMPEVHMTLDSYVQGGANYFSEFLNHVCALLGATKIQETGIGKYWPNHPMGTTIMGNNKRTSVVNSDCQSHDHPNLWIAGSSVFTTGGTANPTLTIAALSLRLADCMIQELTTET